MVISRVTWILVPDGSQTETGSGRDESGGGEDRCDVTLRPKPTPSRDGVCETLESGLILWCLPNLGRNFKLLLN